MKNDDCCRRRPRMPITHMASQDFAVCADGYFWYPIDNRTDWGGGMASLEQAQKSREWANGLADRDALANLLGNTYSLRIVDGGGAHEIRATLAAFSPERLVFESNGHSADRGSDGTC